MLLDSKMDIENVEVSLTEDQKKTIQNLYSVFPRDVTENFVNSLVLRSSLPGIFEPPKSKSPMKQVTLDKWFVKSPKVSKTNEMLNSRMSKSSTTTIPDGSSNNKILVMESSNKALTDEEIIKQIGKKELMISLQRYDFEDNTKERSAAQKGQVIENSDDSPVIAEKTAAESFDVVEKHLTDQSTHFSMSQSAPTKVLIPKTRHSSRHLSLESTEFNSTQSNAVKQRSIVKGKDSDDILENKTSKRNSSLVNKNIAKVLQKRSKSCLNSDGSSIAEKLTTVDQNLDLIKENPTIVLKVFRKTSKSCVIYDSDSSSIAEKLSTVDEDFDLNKSTNDESLALNIPQCVSAKLPTCKTRQRSKILSMENTHTTSHFNLTKQNTGLNNNEGNVLECEAPMQISSFINENVSKYPKSDKQNSVTLSPVHLSSKVTLLPPNLVSLPGKTERAKKKPETTVRTHKQSGTTPKMFEATKEGTKPEATEEGNRKSETSEDGNQMSEKANKKSKRTKGEEDLKVIRKRNKKSKKNKKSDRKSETTEELNDEVLEATEKLKKLLEITEKANNESETIEEGYHMSEEGNHMSGEPNIKLEKAKEGEEKSKIIGKVNKKSKKTKKSIQKLETSEKPDELIETIDKVVQDSETIEKTNKSVTKKGSRKGKMVRRNSKLVTEHSQVVDAAMEIGEISVESRTEVHNEKTPMSVDSPLTKRIRTVDSSEADKLTSEDPQCDAASVGLSQAESDEKQKNYEAFCTLQGVCSSLGINVEHLFQNKKLTRRLKSSCKRDPCAFIQGHKLKNGQTAPSVYMHDSKEQLEEILKTYK